MSLLDNLVGQVLKNSLGNQPQQNNQSDVLGGLLGSVLGGSAQNQPQSGLGVLLGQVVASGLGGSHHNALGGVLGSLLGGQTQRSAIPAGDLGSVLGTVLGGQKRAGGFNKNTLLLALIPVVLAYIQRNGGLSGVLAKFNGNGLGNKAQSWVGLDVDNDGLDAGDIMRLFDKGEINQVCEQTGASETEVCQGIAELLPQVVNELTPNGDVQTDEKAANDEIGQILAQFGKAFAS